MDQKIFGIHHITLIASNRDELVAFYQGLLDMKLLKETVNFDAPDIPHLYFGNEDSEPGSILTFFVYNSAPLGRHGSREVGQIKMACPEELYEEIKAKIQASVYQHEILTDAAGDEQLRIIGPDQVDIVLVPALSDLYMIYSAQLKFTDLNASLGMIEAFGAVKTEEQPDGIARYYFPNGNTYNYLDCVDASALRQSVIGAGSVHHIALEVPDLPAQAEARLVLQGRSIATTDVVDRKYFKSIYFNEPSGILFEIATTEPGFDSVLAELTEGEVGELEGYQYRFIPGLSSRTVVLFHGTGGDENSLINFARKIDPKAKILAIRGNVNENGMLRFFQRFPDGRFNEDDIKNRVILLSAFMRAASVKHEFDLARTILLGYSNGANMIASILLLQPQGLGNAVLLRPTMPLAEATLPKVSFNLLERRVLILSGMSDIEYNVRVPELTKRLTAAGAMVENADILGGHELTEMDEEIIKTWYDTTYR